MLALAGELCLTAQAQKAWLALGVLNSGEAAQRSKSRHEGGELWSWKNQYKDPKNDKSTINEQVLLTTGV